MKCSVRSIFSCCFAFAMSPSSRVLGAIIAMFNLQQFATRRGTCLPRLEYHWMDASVVVGYSSRFIFAVEAV